MMHVSEAFFIGRKDESDRALSALLRGGSVSVVGLPGVGKSAFSEYLMRMISGNPDFIVIDSGFKGAKGFSEASAYSLSRQLCLRIVKYIRRHYGVDLGGLEVADDELMDEMLGRLHNSMSGKHIIIFLDEMNVLEEGCYQKDNVTDFVNNCLLGFSTFGVQFVFFSQYTQLMLRKSNPSLRELLGKIGAESIYLKPFSDRSIGGDFRGFCEGLFPGISSDQIETIWRRFHGHARSSRDFAYAMQIAREGDGGSVSQEAYIGEDEIHEWTRILDAISFDCDPPCTAKDALVKYVITSGEIDVVQREELERFGILTKNGVCEALREYVKKNYANKGLESANVLENGLSSGGEDFGVRCKGGCAGHNENSSSLSDDAQKAQQLLGRAKKYTVVSEAEIKAEILERYQCFGAKGTTILLLGEPGVGKTYFAKKIAEWLELKCHRIDVSARSRGLGVFHSQLVGYTAGSFGGKAKSPMPGLLDAAKGNVLFFDEIADLPADDLCSLRDVVYNRQYISIGKTEPTVSDFVMVAATNKDIVQQVNDGNFPLDFLHRVAKTVVVIPSINERRNEVWPTVEAILREYCLPCDNGKRQIEMSPEVETVIREFAEDPQRSSWPANMRSVVEDFTERLILAAKKNKMRLDGRITEVVCSEYQKGNESVMCNKQGSGREVQQLFRELRICSKKEADFGKLVDLVRSHPRKTRRKIGELFFHDEPGITENAIRFRFKGILGKTRWEDFVRVVLNH